MLGNSRFSGFFVQLHAFLASSYVYVSLPTCILLHENSRSTKSMYYAGNPSLGIFFFCLVGPVLPLDSGDT